MLGLYSKSSLGKPVGEGCMSQNETERQMDEQLRDAVLQALAADARTASLNLRVGVLNGIVHLGGSASSDDDWAWAEMVATHLPGVRGVVNRIEAPGAPSPARAIHLDLL
jgi:osmotically-inducible protein OsmY